MLDFMYVCLCACTCICMYTYIHTYIHIHIHTYIHTYIHTHTHIYAYIHVCVYLELVCVREHKGTMCNFWHCLPKYMYPCTHIRRTCTCRLMQTNPVCMHVLFCLRTDFHACVYVFNQHGLIVWCERVKVQLSAWDACQHTTLQEYLRL
jgi:hypothetical protein